MHTTEELSSTAFVIREHGRSATLHDVLPGFVEHDRVGVVVRRPCGAIGASVLILAAVTAFYDLQRSKGEEFFIYPDYFLFHAGTRLGNHGMLDIWPPHKEVVVVDEAEELLRAINDRGITRLLVEDRTATEPEFERESLASARSRIVTALAYSATGRVKDCDVRAAGNGVTESYVAAVLEQSTEIAPSTKDASRPPGECSTNPRYRSRLTAASRWTRRWPGFDRPPRGRRETAHPAANVGHLPPSPGG